MPGLARAAFSNDALRDIIERHGLYGRERARQSTDEVVNRMRRDIGIQLISGSVFQVSFVSSDGETAQQVAQDLMNQLARSKEEISEFAVQPIDPADAPQVSVSPRRIALAGAGGLGGGALLGMLVGLLRRRAS